MFVLCLACAETTNCRVCGHTRSERCLTDTWVYQVWKYNETMVYDQATSEVGLFLQSMNTFMKIKMKSSGYPVGCATRKRKQLISSAQMHTRDILESMQDVVWCLNSVSYVNSFLTTITVYLTYR